jgi:hypothetical protein
MCSSTSLTHPISNTHCPFHTKVAPTDIDLLYAPTYSANVPYPTAERADIAIPEALHRPPFATKPSRSFVSAWFEQTYGAVEAAATGDEWVTMPRKALEVANVANESIPSDTAEWANRAFRLRGEQADFDEVVGTAPIARQAAYQAIARVVLGAGDIKVGGTALVAGIYCTRANCNCTNCSHAHTHAHCTHAHCPPGLHWPEG